jgi:hypothetical protein
MKHSPQFSQSVVFIKIFVLAIVTLHAQNVQTNDLSIANLGQNIIHADNFINSSSQSFYGGSVNNFSYTSDSGFNVYHPDDTEWGTLLNGQNGWSNLTQQGATNYGPGIIYHNSGDAYADNPNVFALGGDSYFSTDKNNSVTYPQSRTTYIARSAVTPYNQIHFDTTFLIYANKTNSSGQWDSFGWSLLNNQGQSLLSINLDRNPDRKWYLSATPYGSSDKQALTLFNGQQLAGIANNSWAHLGFNIFNLGETNSTIQILRYNGDTSSTNTTTWNTNYTILGNNIIAGGTNSANIAGGNSISQLAATWTLASTDHQLYTNDGIITTGYNNYADNTLLMSTLLISVPEPKTWALMAISGLIMVVALRRKKA